MANTFSFKAGGNILPSRIIKLSDAFTVTQADAAAEDELLGVAAESTKDAPGLTGASANHAESGDPVQYYGPGEFCLVEAGAAITAPDLCKSDANGRAIAATTGTRAVVRVIEDASGAGELVRALVIDPIYVP